MKRTTGYVITNRGYSLLEAMVALTLFVAVMVPLLGKMHSVSIADRAKNRFTAVCILEREAACARVAPETIQPLKRIPVSGVEWTVRTEIQGEAPKTCRIVVYRGENKIVQTVLYCR
jgi:Tfp pilus assembly protein PilV